MRIAVVDDEEMVRKQIESYVKQFCQTKELPVECVCFEEAVTFLKNYKASFDAVFLDIKMPGYNGMEAAKILRQTDQNTILVFITNLKQYAIHGYDVDAIGFVVKPITQYDFDVVMDKVVRRIEAGISRDITVKTANGMSRLKINDIYYIEVIKHKLIFHTVFGLVESWGTLVTTEKMLPDRSFSRCNVCYLVNLRHVQSVDRETVTVCGESLKIARSRKREFMMDLARYEGTMEG